jgi:UDP:flavonoid glycosyltransferase YjiC (YdhE family)
MQGSRPRDARLCRRSDDSWHCLRALSVGLPLVVASLAADQPVCAMGCVHAGVAESLAPIPPLDAFLACVTDPAPVTRAQVTSAVRRVLDAETYREAARRIAAQIAAIPPPEPPCRGRSG